MIYYYEIHNGNVFFTGKGKRERERIGGLSVKQKFHFVKTVINEGMGENRMIYITYSFRSIAQTEHRQPKRSFNDVLWIFDDETKKKNRNKRDTFLFFFFCFI